MIRVPPTRSTATWEAGAMQKLTPWLMGFVWKQAA